MHGLHAANLRNAHIFLDILGLKDVRIEEAVNKAKQEAVECGWFVCHYMEELLRCSAGQPKQSQGWPNLHRLSKLTAYVKRMVESLEAEREKWCKEVEADNVKIEKFEKDMQKKTAQAFRSMELSKRVLELHHQLSHT